VIQIQHQILNAGCRCENAHIIVERGKAKSVMQVSLIVFIGKYVVINLMSSEKFQVANHRKLADIMWLSDLFCMTNFLS